MKFHYVAAQKDDRLVEGNLDAGNQYEVLNFLAAKGLRPISVQASSIFKAFRGQKKIFGKGITVSDKIFLTKYLALMLKVNTDLFRAIDILVIDFKKPMLKELLTEVKTALENGKPFYSTFERYPNFFPPVFVNMIKAGEESGTLEKVLQDLSTSLEKRKILVGKIRSALIYPIILTVLSFVILIFLLSFALPKIAGVFEGGGIEAPLFSRVVFAVGLFLGKYIFIFILIFIIVTGGFFLFFRKTKPGRRFFSRMLYSTPFVKDILKRVAVQRFASVFGSLLRAGLPMRNSLEITASAVSQLEIREALLRIIKEGIEKGISLGTAFQKETVFPSVVTNLVAVAEKGGHLDEILATLSEFYESEIEESLKTFTSLVEPLMLIVIGLVVGIIALSIIVPIYQLVGQF